MLVRYLMCAVIANLAKGLAAAKEERKKEINEEISFILQESQEL